MCVAGLHVVLPISPKNEHLTKCVRIVIILFVLYVHVPVGCQNTSDQTPSNLHSDRDPNSEKLAHLTYLTKIAFHKNFNLERVNVSASNNTKEEIFQESITKILSSLYKIKRAITNEHSSKPCDDIPVVSSEVALRNFCKEAHATQCLSVKQIASVLPVGADSFSEALSYVCPFLLLQSHDQTCQKQFENPPKKTSSKPSSGSVWGFGFLFVTLVSCCSLVGVGLLPLLSKSFYHMVLVLFEGLAVGSLASSALFHLIPQAFNLLGQDAQHDYLWKALIIFGGIYLFFLSERTMKIFIQRKEKKRRKKELTRNGNRLSLNKSPTASAISTTTLENGVLGETTKETSVEETYLPAENEHGYNNHSNHQHQHQHLAQGDFQKGKNVIATVAWMIIFGDGLHNFIDGLSMGAAFSESIMSGISISVAVICEEFPHELGDFAVLLSAGMTMKQALMYNFLSACTCYLGLVFGVLLGDLAEGGPYIFALAGGMFLYISLVDMVGELSEALESASKEGTKEMLKVFALQNAGIIIGVAALFLMARYSERINFEALSDENTTSNMIPQIIDFFHTNHNNRAPEDAMLGL